MTDHVQTIDLILIIDVNRRELLTTLTYFGDTMHEILKLLLCYILIRI